MITNNYISLPDFVEKILDIKLLPHQKNYLEAYEKIPKGTKFVFARGQSHIRFIYAMMYKQLWLDYLENIKEKNNVQNYYRIH